jgi:type II secretory pathway pseudopilin PulG
MKEMLREPIRLLPVLRNKLRSFTLIEVLFVVLTFGVITGVLFYALSGVQLSFNSSSARGSLQSEVRRTISWIIKDTHQTVSWNIANNSPTPSYIKFRQVIGWDTTNNTFLLSDYYVEYIYNAVDKTITRRTSDLSDNTIGTWVLRDVVAAPFFTINSSGEIVSLNNSDLLTSKQLVVTISGQKQVLGMPDTTYSLTEEVQIRNG